MLEVLSKTYGRAILRRLKNSSHPNHMRPARRRRFYLAVQTNLEPSAVLATADVPQRYPNSFRRSLQYEIQHWPRACNSSARQSLAEAWINRRRTVPLPPESVHPASGADDSRTEVYAPSTASFTSA